MYPIDANNRDSSALILRISTFPVSKQSGNWYASRSNTTPGGFNCAINVYVDPVNPGGKVPINEMDGLISRNHRMIQKIETRHLYHKEQWPQFLASWKLHHEPVSLIVHFVLLQLAQQVPIMNTFKWWIIHRILM